MAHDKPLYKGLDHETAAQLGALELQVFQNLWLVQKAYSDQLTKNSTGSPELDDFIQALIPFHGSNDAPEGNKFEASNYSNPIYNTDQNTIQNYDLILGFNEANRYADLLLETHPNRDFIGVRLLPFQSTFYLENIQGTPQARLLLGLWSHGNMVQSYRTLIDEHGSELPPEVVQALDEFVNAFEVFDDLVNQHNEALATFNESLNTALQMATGLLGDFDPIGFLLENAPTPPEEVPGEEDLPERPQITPTAPTAGEIFKAMQPVFSIVRAVKREKDETVGGFYTFLNEVLKQILESFSLEQIAEFNSSTAKTATDGADQATRTVDDFLNDLDAPFLFEVLNEINANYDNLTKGTTAAIEGFVAVINQEVAFFTQAQQALNGSLSQLTQFVQTQQDNAPKPGAAVLFVQNMLGSINKSVEEQDLVKQLTDLIAEGNSVLATLNETLEQLKDPTLPVDGIPSVGDAPIPSGLPTAGQITQAVMGFMGKSKLIKSWLTSIVGVVIMATTIAGVVVEPSITWNDRWVELGLGLFFLGMDDEQFKRFIKLKAQ